jgi:hypothetical protein
VCEQLPETGVGTAATVVDWRTKPKPTMRCLLLDFRYGSTVVATFPRCYLWWYVWSYEFEFCCFCNQEILTILKTHENTQHHEHQRTHENRYFKKLAVFPAGPTIKSNFGEMSGLECSRGLDPSELIVPPRMHAHVDLHTCLWTHVLSSTKGESA